MAGGDGGKPAATRWSRLDDRYRRCAVASAIRMALQGNMDPPVLYAPPARIERVATILAGFGRGGRSVFGGLASSQDDGRVITLAFYGEDQLTVRVGARFCKIRTGGFDGRGGIKTAQGVRGFLSFREYHRAAGGVGTARKARFAVCGRSRYSHPEVTAASPVILDCWWTCQPSVWRKNGW